MRSMDQRKIAWAAGLFDGEGCVDLDVPRRWNLRLTLGMCHRPSVLKFCAVFGRSGSSFYKGSGSRPLWVVKYHGKMAHDVLILLLPFLVTKKAKARVAVTLMGKRISKKWQRLTAVEKRQWMTADRRLSELKRRRYNG